MDMCFFRFTSFRAVGKLLRPSLTFVKVKVMNSKFGEFC